MAELTRENVLKALSHVEDPDLKKDLVTLNMIRNIEIADKRVSFTLMLTTPACPLKELLKNRCNEAIHKHIDPSVDINIDLDSMVTSARSENETMLAGIKNIIGVASGKGGVGKSTIAVNMALGLTRTGAKTGLLDADIHGPSVPSMLDISAQPGAFERDGKTMLIPVESYGLKVMSMGMLVDEKQPLIWRGPMLSSTLKQMMTDVEWGELDYLIIDLPPGTGDIHLSLAQQFPLNGVVIVTTPQKVSVNDTRRTIEMFKAEQINIPILGLVENMAWFTPKELPENKYYLFGQGGGKELAEAYNIPFLQQIPLFMGVTEQSDKGKPAILSEEKYIRRPFMDMAGKAAQEMARKNAEMVGVTSA